MLKDRRFLILSPLIVLACAVLGGVFGPEMDSAAAASTAAGRDEIEASVRTFTQVYTVAAANFADRVNPDRAIFKGAIQGMLRTLDPHSSFFDPREFQLLREEQRGHYYGVGMTVAERNRRTIVIAPFPGSPAYKAGIRPGDIILQVNDTRTDNLSVSEVADKLKGPRGTHVKVVVSREGSPEPLTFDIVRDEIPRKSVQEAFWIKPGIAYLDIDSFNENTSREVEETLRRLGEDKITLLILDMRENPGGLLNEGVAVAERFLQKGQVIVSHRGRSSPEKPYVARQGSKGLNYPIVVLVNRYSASAAEIVAGALQDHDRAWILGENTFGKGLVQTVYPLGENTGLALTTAKYYTPSGRLIQRDYTGQSFIDYYTRKNLDAKNPLDVKMTDSGRTVYGGGGIAPDEKFSLPPLNRFQSDTLYRKYAFFNFATRYFGSRNPKLSRDWEPDQMVLDEFRQFLRSENVSFTEAEFADNLAWIKQQLKREFFVMAFGAEEARRLAVESDPVVAKAIEALPKAKELLDLSRKNVAHTSKRRAERK